MKMKTRRYKQSGEREGNKKRAWSYTRVQRKRSTGSDQTLIPPPFISPTPELLTEVMVGRGEFVVREVVLEGRGEPVVPLLDPDGLALARGVAFPGEFVLPVGVVGPGEFALPLGVVGPGESALLVGVVTGPGESVGPVGFAGCGVFVEVAGPGLFVGVAGPGVSGGGMVGPDRPVGVLVL